MPCLSRFPIATAFLSMLILAPGRLCLASEPVDVPLKNWPAPRYWAPAVPPEGAGEQAQSGKSSFGAAAQPRQANVTPLTGPLVFIGITPCRLVDTRSYMGMPAPFGAPALASYSTRSFPVLSHPNCVLPPTAKAYSLNLLAIPAGPLSFLSAWPGGYPYPYTSFLNSSDGGMVNNAVVIAAGVGGAINVLAGSPTELIIDINGYYVEMSESNRTLGGVIAADGAAQSLPAGASSTRSGTGQYVISFPPNTFPAGSSPAPVLSPIGAIATLQGASVVRLSDGSGILTVNWSNDVAFSFLIAPN